MIKKFYKSDLYCTGLITRCIQTIANDVAQIGWRHVYVNLDNKNYQVIDSVMDYLVSCEPNNVRSLFELKKAIVWNLFLYGTAYIVPVNEDETDSLDYLICLSPLEVRIKNFKNEISYIINSEKHNFKNAEFYDLVKIDYENINLNGTNTFAQLFESTLQKHVNFEESLLKNNCGCDDNSKCKCKGKCNGIFFDYEVKKSIDSEVAMAFGIPPQKLGIESNANYNSSSDITKQYINNALLPILSLITSKLSQHGLDVEYQQIIYNPKDLLRLYDHDAIVNLLNLTSDQDVLSNNEIRDVLGIANFELSEEEES